MPWLSADTFCEDPLDDVYAVRSRAELDAEIIEEARALRDIGGVRHRNADIYRRFTAGSTLDELATEYGLKRHTVRKIVGA